MPQLRYEEFVDARLTPLLRYAVMLTGSQHTAQDLVQETLIRVHKYWKRVSRSSSPERYVHRMLTNAYIDMRKGWWARRVTLRAEPEDLPDPVDHADRTAERDRMWTLLAGLPRRQRAMLVLRYYEGLPDAEIAEVLGCGVATVRSTICRALASLRTTLAPTHTDRMAPVTTTGTGGNRHG